MKTLYLIATLTIGNIHTEIITKLHNTVFELIYIQWTQNTAEHLTESGKNSSGQVKILEICNKEIIFLFW